MSTSGALPVARLAGLVPRQAEALSRAARHLERGELAAAETALLAAAIGAADHPEVLRWQGRLAWRQGRLAAAVDSLATALDRRGEDAELQLDLAEVHLQSGADPLAVALAERAGTAARSADQRRRAAGLLDRLGCPESAGALATMVLREHADDVAMRLTRIRSRQATGDIAGAADDCRRLIRADRATARAWFSLLELKSGALEADELARLESTRAAALGDDRVLLGFALGRALEAAGRFVEAFAVLCEANAAVRGNEPWSLDEVRAVLDGAPAPGDSAPGEAGLPAVLFVVGLPRSGSTLFEQVLAAHPAVEAASELPWLPQVLEEESRRRGRPFAQWAAQADDADWRRLGADYLERSARWRLRRPVSTDKLPSNWMYAAAIRRMLPEARIIDCRRDALETCWSCFKQRFAPRAVGYAQDFGELAAYWRLYVASATAFAARWPRRFRTFHYEALVAAPEREIRDLLDWCGLPFEPACLEPHRAQRVVRTASAAQVRQPLGPRPALADRYGPLLDPLRALLAHRAETRG